MRALRGCIIVLALGPGLFMTFDGLRALILGDYLTPTTGRFAGQLGPWSDVVVTVGIAPRSPTMKIAFVLFGLAWLWGIGGFLRGTRWSTRALVVVAIGTLWYLPVGTLMSVLVLIGLGLLRRRSNRPLQSSSGAEARRV
jgi:hypothetical protein